MLVRTNHTSCPTFYSGVFLLLVILAGCTSTPSERSISQADSLSQHIGELRCQGQYAEALKVARGLLQLLEQDPAIEAWRREDAGWLTATLRLVASLPEETRRELARADQLIGEIDQHRAKGEYLQGAALAEEELEIRTRCLGAEHLEVTRSLTRRAALLRHGGKYRRAQPLYERALQIREKTLGPEHLEVASALNNLGLLLWSAGEHAQARSLHERALRIREETLGPEHLEVGQILNNLGLVLYATGEYKQARPLYERALRIREKGLGPEHPDVGQTLNNLGLLLWILGDNQGARPLYERALRIREKTLGPEHPDVGQILNNLGLVLCATGEYKQARPVYERALRIREKALGPDHPDVAQTLSNLALLLEVVGDYETARSMHERALEIKERALGPEHPDVALVLTSLAHLLRKTSEYERARPLHQRALTIRESALGPEHPDVARTLDDLAFLLAEMGDYGAARPLYERALRIKEKVFDPDNPELAHTMNRLGILLWRTGDYGRARPLYERALAIQEKALGPDHPTVAPTLNNIAILLSLTGDDAGAQLRYERALEIGEKALGADHMVVALRLSNLGLLFAHRGEYERARPLYDRALRINEKALGPEHPAVATTLGNLGCLLEGTRDYEGARPLYDRALAIKEKAFGPEHPSVAVALRDLARLSCQTDEYEHGRQLYERSLAITERNFGLEHPRTSATLRELALLRWEADGAAVAQPLLLRSAKAFEVARLRTEVGLERASILTSPYPALAAACLELGRPGEAWQWVERTLGRVLADLLLASNGRSLSPREAAKEDSLKKTLGKLEGRLLTLHAAPHAGTLAVRSDRIDQTRFRLLEVEAALKTFQESMAAKYPVTEGGAIPLARVQAALAESSALIGWLHTRTGGKEQTAWGYVITKQGPVNWVRMGSSRQKSHERLSHGAREFRRALAIAATWQERVTMAGAVSSLAEGVWTDWVGPLAPMLAGIDHLVVVPSGPMLGLPIEALVDSAGVHLGDRYAVSYAPSATVYAWLRERGEDRDAQPRRSALLVGDPAFTADDLFAVALRDETGDLVRAAVEPASEAVTLSSASAGHPEVWGRLARLPWTREEVERVASLFQEKTTLLGPRASEQELVRLGESGALRQFHVIHVATHALIDDETPERSALALSRVGLPDPLEAAMTNSRIYDGFLTAREIVREWDLDADIVTLSGCQTGLGREIPGEGYFGLAHAFLQAGTRSLLVSLWGVEEKATCLLMSRFYENLLGSFREERGGPAAEPMSKAEALQEAKHWLRTHASADGGRPFHHPVYWSGFVLIGDPG